MRNIARVVATAALATAAVLTAGGVAAADGGGSIDWPVAPVSVSAAPQAAAVTVPAAGRIDWP